jgi:NAD(P)-dependent dehydrogenase (short-subunit alcohol dehydrogenase family)
VIASTLAHRPLATSAVYSAAKAGLLAAMKSFALAGAKKRIRMNAVAPGVVDTDMVRAPRGGAPLAGANADAHVETLRLLHPLGRLGTPSDIADAVLYLLSASWVTGATLDIDGGILLRE